MKNVIHQHKIVGGRDVDIFDGAVDFSERQKIYSFVRSSLFLIGNEDGDALESSHHRYMCSMYTERDVHNCGILSAISGTPVEKIIAGKPLVRAHINLSNHTDVHWAHDHRDQIGLLYYVNKHWKHEWAGETMFFNDDLSEVEYASVYKPGRIIIFDGEIPHSVRPQSSVAPGYRFTLSLFFAKT